MTADIYLATGAGVHRDKYHTDPECRALRRAQGQRAVDPTAISDDRMECRLCSGEAPNAKKPNGKTPHKGTCRTCGDELDGDGECAFCTSFAEAIGHK